MPTIEKIADTIIPQTKEQPIPVRVISTKSVKSQAEEKPAPKNQDQTNKVESKGVAETSTQTEEKTVTLGSQLSAVARKEQAFRQRESALAEREKTFEQRIASADQFEQLRAKIKAKDFSVLESLGLTYEDIVKYELDKQTTTDPNAIAVSELRKELEDMKRGQEENADKQFEETVAEYRLQIGKLVADTPEFSTIKELKLDEHVLQVILDAWEIDGEHLSIEEACKDVEDYALEYSKRFSAVSKLKPPEASAEKLPPPRTGAKVKTITNDMGAISDLLSTPLHKLPDDKRIAAARARVLARRAQQG